MSKKPESQAKAKSTVKPKRKYHRIKHRTPKASRTDTSPTAQSQSEAPDSPLLIGSDKGTNIKVVGHPINIPAYDTAGDSPNGPTSSPDGPTGRDLTTGGVPAGKPEQGPDFEKLNAQLLAASFMTINAFLEAGGYEPCKFTDEEQELLKEIWGPYMPHMPPWMSAVIGTAVILTPKAMLFMQIRAQKLKEAKEKGIAV